MAAAAGALVAATPDSAGADEVPTRGAAVTVSHAEQFTITASGSGRRYRIFVALPRDESPPDGYPVIYLLDGNAVFLTGVEAMRLQTRKPKGFVPAVLVAIGYETEEALDSKRRYVDYTTPARDEDLPRRRSGEPFGERGGADAFLDFIARDLQPRIAQSLPVNRDRQTLSGHSLGGLLTLYCFLTRPEMFATYVAGSPSVWWNKHELLHRAETVVGEKPDLTGKRLLIAIGGDELDDMLDGARRMADALAPLEAQGLAMDYTEFAGEEHITVLPALISRAIGFSLKAYGVPPQ